MNRLMLTADLHLGHKTIHTYRTQFATAEQHHEIVFDNLASNINKRDSLYILGDVAFTPYWLYRLDEIRCVKKTLILGNHDTQYLSLPQLLVVFDSIHSLFGKHHCLFSHCPVHPSQFRKNIINIHGHLHSKVVPLETKKFIRLNNEGEFEDFYYPDKRYFNVCLEHTNYKPISFTEITEIVKGRGIIL